MKITLSVLLLFVACSCFGQTKITLQNIEYNEEFFVSEKNNIKPKDSLNYYWFKAKEIHISQSICPGKPLDWDYISFYKNNQIRSKGYYSNGLRSGEWQYWSKDGMLSKTEKYKKGILDQPAKSESNETEILPETESISSDTTEVETGRKFLPKLFKKSE